MKQHIPNTLTCLNLAVGVAGIHHVLLVDRMDAIYFVAVAAVFDFFDGFAARALKVKSAFGMELDSLADAVSFGVLPAMFMLRWLEELSDLYFVAILIAVCSALRLAKFNLDTEQTLSFRGLPTPANAILLTSLAFLDYALNEITLIGITIVSCLLLVSNLKLMALKFEHFGWKGNEWRFGFLVSLLILFVVFKWTFVPLLIPFYIVVSLLSGVSLKSTK